MSAPLEQSPQEMWLEALGFVGVALMARPAMKAGKTQADRDSATRIYVNAVDQLVDWMEAMAARGHLDDVGGFLATQFGRA